MTARATGKSHSSHSAESAIYKGDTAVWEDTPRILNVRTIRPEDLRNQPMGGDQHDLTKNFQPPRVITALRKVAVEMLQVASELESQDRKSGRVVSHLQIVESELDVVARELHKVAEGLQRLSRTNSLFANERDEGEEDGEENENGQPRQLENEGEDELDRAPLLFCDIFDKPEDCKEVASEGGDLKRRRKRWVDPAEAKKLRGDSSKESLVGGTAYKKFQGEGCSADEYADDEDEEDDDDEDDGEDVDVDDESDKSVGEECDWGDEDEGDDPYTEDVDFTDTLEEDSEKEVAFLGYGGGEEGDDCCC